MSKTQTTDRKLDKAKTAFARKQADAARMAAGALLILGLGWTALLAAAPAARAEATDNAELPYYVAPQHSSGGSAWHLLTLDSVDINYRRFQDHSRNMLIYPNEPKEAINVGINMDLFKVMYWDNTIRSLTDNGQYRGIGLNLKLGVRLWDNLRFEYEHLSQHVLDAHHSYMNKFPVEDSLGIVLRVYQAPTKRESVFGE